MDDPKRSDAIYLARQTFDLLALASADTILHKSGQWYYGPCPFCPDHGSDRFLVKSTPEGWKWFCRQCGDGKYNDAIDYIMRRENLPFSEAVSTIVGESILSDPKIEEIKARQRQMEAQRQAEIDCKLAALSTQEIWEAFQRRMNAEHRAWWQAQGVPEDWQEYLKLGYTPDKPYEHAGVLCHSPAYTIPYFHFSPKKLNFRTIQYRLTEPPEPQDKYRFEADLGTTFYMTTPTLPIGPEILVCEGAKKGIVARLNTPKDITVLAVPGKNDIYSIAEAIKEAQKVWIALDPDATEWAYKLAELIGKAARVVEIPTKLDDAFLFHKLRPKGWEEILRQGVKVVL